MSNSLQIKFIEACSSGKIEEFNKVMSTLSNKQKKELLEFDDYACFHLAAANGHLNILNAIINDIKALTDEEPADEALIPVFLARNAEGFKLALLKHIKTAERILIEEYLFDDCINIIAETPEFIKTIWNSPLRNCILYIFEKYCAQDILLVQNILKNIPKSEWYLLLEDIPNTFFITDNLAITQLTPFENSCDGGKLDVLQLLWSTLTPSQQKKMITTRFESCLILAAKNGYLKIIRQLLNWVEPEQKILLLTSNDFNAFVYAADNDHVEVMQLIWKLLPPLLQSKALAASNFSAYRLATKNNHSRVIAFLEESASEATLEKMKKAVKQGVFSSKNA